MLCSLASQKRSGAFCNVPGCAPQVLEVLQCNIDSNSLSDRGRVHQIHWKTWRGEPDFGYFELVLGADLLYASAVVKVRCAESDPAGT